MTLYDKYIKEVESGDIVTGELVKLAIKRHLNDLERAKKDDYPYYFDPFYADHILKFVGMCKLSGDEFQGTPFPIQPFQAWYYAMVYGWRNKETKLRRFRRVYWSTARKSAKSEMTAPECIYHLFVEAKGSVQVVIGATTFDQGKYIYKPCEYMVRELMKVSAHANNTLKPQQYIIKNLETGGYITRITGEANKNDGAGVVFGVVDEYHAAANDDIVGVISTSQGTNRQPILKIATTAGFNKEGPDFVFREYCKSVLRGQVVDERLFVGIYAMDDGDDYHDKTNWAKPNPMLGITPTMEFMETEYQNAVNQGGDKIVQFLTKNLNQYTDAASVWISDEHYMKLANRKSLDELQGKFCFVGVDLASIMDLTAVTVFFPAQPGLDKDYYTTQYFCPETKFSKVRVDGVEYNEFLKDGWVRKTEGNVIDKIGILNHASDILTNSDLIILGYDPFKAVDIVLELQELGIECVQVRQGIPSLGQAVDYWEKQMFNEQIEHDGSPVTRWQMSNVEFARDNNNNKKIVKSNGRKEAKVDGPVSIEIAIAVYLEWKKDNDKGMGEDEMRKFLEETGQI